MISKLIRKLFLSMIVILYIDAFGACSAFVSAPTPTVVIATSTTIPTKTQVFSVTGTLTPKPSPTATPLSIISFPTETISAENINQIKLLDVREFADKPEGFISYRMFFTPNGDMVVATNHDTSDTKIYVWNGFTGQSIVTLEQADPVWDIAISPNGKTVASFNNDGILKLWDVQSGKEIYTLAQDVTWNTSWSSAFAPDNTIVASGDFDGKVTFWDTHNGKQLSNLADPNGTIHSIVFSPDGKALAIGTAYRITLWDIVTQRLIRTLDFGIKAIQGNGIRRVFFSPDGTMIAATNFDDIAIVWNVSSGKKISTIVGQSVLVSEGALAFSPDSKIIAMGNDTYGGIILWDVLANKELRTIGSELCIPLDLVFWSKGNILQVGCYDGTIQFWGLS